MHLITWFLTLFKQSHGMIFALMICSHHIIRSQTLPTCAMPHCLFNKMGDLWPTMASSPVPSQWHITETQQILPTCAIPPCSVNKMCDLWPTRPTLKISLFPIYAISCEIRQIFKGDLIKFCVFLQKSLWSSPKIVKKSFNCKKHVINTTKCDLCLFLHKMCCKMVWKLWDLKNLMGIGFQMGQILSDLISQCQVWHVWFPLTRPY